jgi:fructokinase
MSMFVVAGESLIDLVGGPDGGFVPIPGGGPYNFARALALQDVPTAYANPFSEDSFGSLLRQTLQAAGAQHLGETSAKPTSLALVTTDARGQPHYSFYREGVADRALDKEALLALLSNDILGFHTGALALVPPDDATMMELVRHCRTQGTLCTVDVNMRPQITQTLGISASRYRDGALAVLSAAHVAKVSDEDLHHLGFSGVPQVAARALLHRGCRLVVLTLGENGAWAIGPEAQVFAPAQVVNAVDTVGAGDCFFAGFVASLQHQGILGDLRDQAPSGDVLARALNHAAVCAAINIGRKGCQPPTWDEAVRWRP